MPPRTDTETGVTYSRTKCLRQSDSSSLNPAITYSDSVIYGRSGWWSGSHYWSAKHGYVEITPASCDEGYHYEEFTLPEGITFHVDAKECWDSTPGGEMIDLSSHGHELEGRNEVRGVGARSARI